MSNQEKKTTTAGYESHTRMRFMAEIIMASRVDLDQGVELGAGFRLFDIVNNLEVAGSNTGISGVYVHFTSGANLAFRAMKAATKGSKLKTKTYSIKRYGIHKAFMLAVQKRAEFVGYEGHIPDISPPSIETILSMCEEKKGKAWVKKNDLSYLHS